MPSHTKYFPSSDSTQANRLVVRVAGGLGNQLFQYATARSMAMRLRLPLYVDTTFYTTQTSSSVATREYLLPDLNVASESLTNLEQEYLRYLLSRNAITRNLARIASFVGLSTDPLVWNESLHRTFGMPPPRNRAVYLVGFWQDYLSFNNIRDSLSRELTPKHPAPTAVSELLPELGNQSAAIHIRRGDYLTADVQRVYGILSTSYYHEAISRIRQKSPSIKLFFFSDDPQWVKDTFVNQYGGNVVNYAEQHTQPYWDIYLMRHFTHHVLANSTFSWWGAYLRYTSHGDVYIPQSWLARPVNRHNRLLLPGWIAL